VAVSFHKPQFGKKTNSITTYKKKKWLILKLFVLLLFF
jgi:hypothetical protein